MKRFIKIFSFALVLSLFFTNAYTAVVNGTQISLRRSYPVGGVTRPSRCPAQTTSPVEVFLDYYNGVVTFVGNNDDTVSFFIYDDEGVCVSQGACSFDENHSYSISLCLEKGTYTIVVLINDVEYYGVFDVEE